MLLKTTAINLRVTAAILLGVIALLLHGASLSAAVTAAPAAGRALRPTTHDFLSVSNNFQPLLDGDVAWGDYDNDGDLDVLFSGQALMPYGGGYRTEDFTQLYRNDAGGFSSVSSGLIALRESRVAWGDYDDDGDLDLALLGKSGALDVAKIYRNDGGFFQDIGAEIARVDAGAVAWGDYDNDGDLDLVLEGSTSNGPLTQLYRNDSGEFHHVNAALPQVQSGDLAWGDYDNDGDLDLLLTGSVRVQPNVYDAISKLLRNDGAGQFVDSGVNIEGMRTTALAWGDYDNDGNLDFLISGWADSSGSNLPENYIYHNDGAGSFTQAASFDGGNYSPATTADWGDSDNDGDLDLLVTGYYEYFIGPDDEVEFEMFARIYSNDGGSFNEAWSSLDGIYEGAAAWGDYDGDGSLDFLVVGASFNASPFAALYQNVGGPANSGPQAPGNLSAQVAPGGQEVVFAWSAPADDHTPAGGLSYNLRVGTSSGGSDVFSTMADTSSGFRRIPATGPLQALSYTLSLEPIYTYYWSVQAVDSSFSGGAFAAEASVEPTGPTRTPSLTRTVTKTRTPTITPTPTATSTPLGDFSPVSTSLQPVSDSAAAWGDYDNDGDLDLLLTGRAVDSSIGRAVRYSKVYRNEGADFVDTHAALTPLSGGSAEWGDYDNDGDLDILLTGTDGSEGHSELYRNDDGTFTPVPIALEPLVFGSATFGDYDNDGDLDILLAGTSHAAGLTKLYRNDNGAFSDSGMVFDPGYDARWGDYDHDGDLDLMVIAFASSHVLIQRNDGGVFHSGGSFATSMTVTAIDWGDYDNDGDLDILLLGYTRTAAVSAIYRNDGGTFADIGAGLLGLEDGNVAWVDYDNDGDLDAMTNGYRPVAGGSLGQGPFESYFRLYHNNGGSFSYDSSNGLQVGGATWGDYDADGDQDALLSGYEPDGLTEFITLYANTGAAANDPPAAPGNLSAQVAPGGSAVTFAWNAPADDHTPAGGLAYNLRVGTTPGSSEVFSAMSSLGNGYRRIAARGPIAPLSYTLQLQPGHTYYWSVQALDSSQSGGPFAALHSIAVPAATRTPTSTATASNTATVITGGTTTATTTPTLSVTPTRSSTTTAVVSGTSTPTATRTPTSTTTTTATRTATLTLTGTAAPASTATPTAISFGDVHTDDYFYAAVTYLSAAGVINGYADGTFRPYNNTTRSQLVKIVVLANGWTLLEPGQPTFADVPTSDPFYRYVETARARGIISGYADGRFRPYNLITRGQTAKVIALAQGWALLNPATPSFRDVPPSNPFYREIETAADKGVISGYSVADGREFRWGNFATRGQIAKIVYGAVSAAP